jgi:hypothetical protein
MNDKDGEVIVVSFVKLRDGVASERFAKFATSMDLPVWRSKDVVLNFETYRVTDQTDARVDADFIEVMHLRSWDEWQRVGSEDPDIAPLATAFGELVDEARVRRIFATRVTDSD